MKTIAAETRHEDVVKHSRFLAVAAPIEESGEAPLVIARLSDPSATHNCWAWRVGERYRSSDDGEPGGTAGRPILAALDGQGLDRVVVVVSRWFGGIKLGTGGLVRAYGGAAARCLQRAPQVEVVTTSVVRVAVPFDGVGAVFGLVPEERRRGETWGEHGLSLLAEIPEQDLDSLETALKDATRGAARLERVQAGSR